MWVEVILKEYVPKLGHKDEIVRVRRGYAMNYLIPKGYAQLATPSAKKDLEERLKQQKHKEEKIKQQAEELAKKIESLVLQVESIVGEDGKLFGSVTPIQLAKLLKEKGIEVDRRKITLPEEVRQTGSYYAIIHLHREVKATLRFEVVAKEK